MDSLCRLCGSEEGIRVSIFEPGTEHVKKIHKILPITVNEHDPFPKSMCHRCSFKVNEFFEFRTNCIKAQEVFKSKVPWLKDKHVTDFGHNGHPPMVEVSLNPVNAVSPNEKQITRNIDVGNEPTVDNPLNPVHAVSCNELQTSSESIFIDENEPMIIVEDDSLPYKEGSQISNLLLYKCGEEDKIIMKIKKSDVKRKPKSRSIWDTKKRKKKSHKPCRITEVFTTSINDYQSMGNIENDPLCLSLDGNSENKDTFSFLTKSSRNEYSCIDKGVLTHEKPGENIPLPNYILVTNIPRVGLVYTCEKCGRTFLSPQPASLHTCNDLDYNDDNRSKGNKHDSPSKPIDLYSCNECGQVFSRHSQLVTHQKKHYEVESSSDDNFIPFNQRKKNHAKKKSSYRLLNNSNTFPVHFDQRETVTTRHSLLSSDSE